MRVDRELSSPGAVTGVTHTSELERLQMPKIRVLLIEDNRLLREGITRMLNAEPDLKVTSSTGIGEAFEKAKKLPPDIVLLDLSLKNQNIVTVVASLRKQFPDTQVIVMDLIPAYVEVVEFVKAGVAGFILQDATLRDFLTTIRSVAKGLRVLPPPMTESLFSQIVESALQGGNVGRLVSAVKMTRREQDVVALIATGKSNKEIARELNIAVYTVKSHLHNILEKLALHTRLELATCAHSQGMPARPAIETPENPV
jgi:DNA-binding NarL/FixJ family response regulator